MSTTLKKYTDFLRTLRGKILLGCDGFVDETYEIVEVRKSQSEFTPMKRLRQFGELIVARADGGVGLELVPKRRCEGGFAINTGKVAAYLGLMPRLPGLFGGKAIDPAYEQFQGICELYSLGDPALTIALEFGDGKVLMSNLEAVSSLNWGDFQRHFGEEKLKEMFSGVDILGLGYWSLTANFDELFKAFMEQYATMTPPRRMFFDFADIKKKSSESFIRSLDLIKSFGGRVPMVLSLNEHEVLELFSRIGVPRPELTPVAISSALAIARAKIGFAELIVHTPEFAAASSAAEGEAHAIQDRQSKVVRLAGAGDSFNGGYLCASLGDLSLRERLVVANAVTAFFVTHGSPPNKEELIAQIEKASDK
jgi:hypothetical protein